jgi:hypothetical protein
MLMETNTRRREREEILGELVDLIGDIAALSRRATGIMHKVLMLDLAVPADAPAPKPRREVMLKDLIAEEWVRDDGGSTDEIAALHGTTGASVRGTISRMRKDKDPRILEGDRKRGISNGHDTVAPPAGTVLRSADEAKFSYTEIPAESRPGATVASSPQGAVTGEEVRRISSSPVQSPEPDPAPEPEPVRPTKKEAVLDMYGATNLSYREIAARLTLEEGSVRVFCSQARVARDERVLRGDRARDAVGSRKPGPKKPAASEIPATPAPAHSVPDSVLPDPEPTGPLIAIEAGHVRGPNGQKLPASKSAALSLARMADGQAYTVSALAKIGLWPNDNACQAWLARMTGPLREIGLDLVKIASNLYRLRALQDATA